MAESGEKLLETVESEVVEPTATVTDSDNSQSSAGAPPDITQIGSSFDDESEAYCSDPPDLNPEDADLDSIDQLPKTVSVTDTLEITDSNGPPDLTNSDDFDYGSSQEVYGLESDYPAIIEAEGCPQDPDDPVGIESEAFLTANSPQDNSPFISESGTDISLAQEVSKNYLVNRYSESRYSESLLAVAPDDILPVRPGDILPLQGTQQPPVPVPTQQPVKRGPGRPRKDGLEAPIRKKTKVKSSIKAAHNIMAQNAMSHFSQMEALDNSSQGSSSLGEITSEIPMETTPFGMSEEESNSMYQLEEGGPDIPVRVCNLCNLAERSLLGQGDICRYEPTPNFNPFKQSTAKLEKKSSPDPEEKEGDKGPKPLTWRRNRGPMKGSRERSKSPRRYPHNWDDDTCFFGNELTFVGFSDDVDLSQIFEPSGHVWAHHCCAAWSEGVVQSCNLLLLYVDKAVFNGLSQKCNYCHRFGATIKCRIQSCDSYYHYPCAAARGCFQDIKTLTLLCPDHTEQAHAIAADEALCVICDSVGNVGEQLFCTSCGHHYHSNCLNPVVSLTPEVRAGWQCPDCKVCQKCRKAGDDNKMLVCDTCDKGYHTYCLKPVMTTIPKNGWKCKNCRVCTDCESRTPGSGPSSRWHHNYSVCDSCYQQRNKGLFCPVCRKAYRQFTSNAMLQCTSCKKHVHRGCDESIELYMDPGSGDQPEYVCIPCKNGPEMDIDLPPYSFPNLNTEDANDEFMKVSGDEFMMKGDVEYDMSSVGENSSQLDSNFLFNEDSVSSMDIDISVIEKGAQQLSQSSYGHPEPSTGGKGGKLSVMSRKKLAVGKTRGRPPLAEKKKRTSSFSERKRGAKPKLKSGLGSSGPYGTVAPSGEVKSKDDDDDDDHPQTLIMADAEDKFVLNQDVCKSCGSFGKGEEGKLIVCTQCGQCYHPYCVSVKVTKVVLQKGWRCLDCTVCEGCGKPHDEGRLILCDECDISYHIYCLEPPLDHVPKGTWKCKWCVKCMYCGTTSPGFGCQWEHNYTQCGPCNSKIYCPICRQNYKEEELIIQCLACDRWLHALCDGLRNEDETERAADFGYNCKFCRPRTGQPGPLPPLAPLSPPTPEEMRSPTPPLMPILPPPIREPEIPKRFLMDGVYLNQTGINIIQNLMAQVPKVRKPRRKKLEQEMAMKAQLEGGFKAPSIARMLSTQSSVDGDEELDDLRSSIDGEATMTFGDGDDTLLSPTGIPNTPLLLGEPVVEEKKKRRRNVVGLGVGGFIPRQRHRAPNKSKVAEGVATGEGEEGEEGEKPFADTEQKQRKKRQARKKSQLENSFPSYLQEAFFGKEILDKSKQDAKQGVKIDPVSEEEQEVPLSPKLLPGLGGEPTTAILHDINQTLSQTHMLPPVSITKDSKSTEEDHIGQIESDIKDFLPDDLSELPPDEDLLRIIGPEITKDDESFEDGSVTSKSELPGTLDSMLSPNNLDVDMLSGLAHMDGQTVEDIFKGVLQDGQEGQPKTAADGFPEGVPSGPQGAGNFPGHIPPFAMGPGGFGPGFSGKPGHPAFQDHTRFHGEFPDQSGWPPAVEGDDDESDSGNSRRKILKWECDEELGSNATISAILYCNMNHQELRTQYPEWSERVKRIAKLWRSLSSEEKQPYLLQARKNRQNVKVTKVSNDLKKQKQKEKAAAAAMGPPLPPGPPPFPQMPEGSPTMPPSQEMRSPLNRVPTNSHIVEGTPPGQIPPGVPSSPVHRGYPGPQADPLQRLQHVGPQDPYSQQPQTPRPMDPNVRPQGMDPYAHPPSTPRPDHFGQSGPNVRPQNIGPGLGQRDPFSATATDPFEQSPTGPRAGAHPGTPQQSPSHSHWPGVAQESDPFSQSPVKQGPDGLQSPSGQINKHPEGFGPQMPRPGAQPMTRPPFSRQNSQGDPYAKMPPTPVSSQPEDPYAFQPSTPRPASEVYQQQAIRMGMPPGQQPRMRLPNVSQSGEMRPPFMRQMSGPPGMPQMPPGAENFHMQRQQFRPQMSPTGQQQMVRPPMGYPDPYSQQPGTPHPGMDMSREPLQHMIAAASRRPTLFPFSGMFSSFMHQNYLGGDKVPQGDQKQQLREILAQKTKIRQRQKEKWPEGTPGAPGPYPGEERFPVPQMPGMPPQGMERWQRPMMVHPPHMHMRPEMQARMRFPEGMRPVGPMRQPGPGGPMPGQNAPFSPNRPVPGQVSPQPGQQLHPQEQMALYHQQMQQNAQQQMSHGGQPPPGAYGHPGMHPGQQPRMPFDPSKGHHVPSSMANMPTSSGADGHMKEADGSLPEEKTKSDKPPKLSVSSLEDKPEEPDNIDDFLDFDGSFDILKYADPELDLDIEGKTIFDDLEDEPDHETEVKNTDKSGDQKQKTSDADENSKGEGHPSGSKGEGNFQSKFLEFSQKKKDDTSGTDNLSESEKSKQEINQIAALLQKSEHLGQKIERRDSQKSDGSGKDHTGPNTPVMDPMGNIQNVGPRHGFPPGLHSPMHQSFSGAAVPSPGSAPGSFQQAPGTPGLVSPKVMPSPRSSAPSPKTPNALSPFSQQPLTPVVAGQQQQSPFSQSTNSPFSPSVTCTQSPFTGTTSTSAPHSPYGTAATQPPFGLQSPMSASQSPGQRSPRGPLTPTNQYMQGQYGKPAMQVSQQGGSLGQAPMYGQSMAGGPRVPYSGPPGGLPGEGYQSEIDPALLSGQAGVRMPGTSVPSSMSGGSLPYQPGQEGMPRFPGQQPMRGVGPGFPGPGKPGMPGFPSGMRMPMRQPSPGLTSPGLATSTSQTPSTRAQLLQEQPLLIQDLLEKEKQEQQRQAQQQAMMHRREGSMEGMMPTGPQQITVPPGMAPYRPRMLEQGAMQRLPMDPNWMPQRMYNQPPEGQPPFHVRMPGQQIGQGPRLPTPFQGQGMGPQGIPPPPQPPIPPMHGEISPEIERQHVQYEDWLMKHSQYLEMQIKALETQIAKCKRTKKAINARNRQAKKVGKELPPNDQIDLERTTQEQTILQKQLEAMRKQLRHHQMVTQDYRAKKRERFGEQSGNVPPPPDTQQPHPQPRIPAGGSTRLPQSARQEYDAYMMNKIRQQQQMTAGPRPPLHTVGYDEKSASPKKSPKVPKAIIQDNNPFSEGYQEREKMEKTITDPHMPGMPTSEQAGDQSEIPRQVPFFTERTMGYDQGLRLPASSGDQQRYHLQGPRYTDPSMGMGDQMPRPQMPSGFPSMDQARMGFRPGVPFSQGYGQPPSLSQSDLGMPPEAEKKPKKRKKKKKAESPANTAPLEPRPPVHFTPQSETEKRIMEILESTAGLRRQQEEKQESEKDPSSKPGTPVKSTQKEAKNNTSASLDPTSTSTLPGADSKPVMTTAGSKLDQSQQHPIVSKPPTSTGSNLNLPSSAELSRESEDSQDSEPILPMNVMIHQQSMPHRASVQQMFGATTPPSQSAMSKVDAPKKSVEMSEDTSRSTSSSPRVPQPSNSPRIPTPHSVEMPRSASGSPRISQSQDGARSTSSSPRIPQSPGQWHPDMHRQAGGPQRYPHPPEGYRSGSTSPRVSDPQLHKMAHSPRVSNVPSPKDIQRSVSSPRAIGHPQLETQRPGSANSDTSRTGSPRIPSNPSPSGMTQYPSEHQGQPQVMPPMGALQAHFMPRMPPRGKSPGRASPRQSQPSPISDAQIMAHSQQMQAAQFQGRKSPGQSLPPSNTGRGMPHYPPSSMPPRPGMMAVQNRFQQPPNFPNGRPPLHGMEHGQRPPHIGMEQARLPHALMEQQSRMAHPGMEHTPRSIHMGMDQPPRPTHVGTDQSSRPTNFGAEQQKPLTQRYMYPYPQSVTSSLAESTLAQLPRFTAKVTTSGDSPNTQNEQQASTATSTGVVTCSAGTGSRSGQMSTNQLDPAVPRSKGEQSGINQSEAVLNRPPYSQSGNMPPHSMQNFPSHHASQNPPSNVVGSSISETVSQASSLPSQMSSASQSYSSKSPVYSSASSGIPPTSQNISKSSDGQSFNQGLHSSSQNVGQSWSVSSSCTPPTQGIYSSTSSTEASQSVSVSSAASSISSTLKESQSLSQTSSVTETTESSDPKSADSKGGGEPSQTSQ